MPKKVKSRLTYRKSSWRARKKRIENAKPSKADDTDHALAEGTSQKNSVQTTEQRSAAQATEYHRSISTARNNNDNQKQHQPQMQSTELVRQQLPNPKINIQSIHILQPPQRLSPTINLKRKQVQENEINRDKAPTLQQSICQEEQINKKRKLEENVNTTKTKLAGILVTMHLFDNCAPPIEEEIGSSEEWATVAVEEEIEENDCGQLSSKI